jgi:glycopeptide antibiotics resistance protein
VSHGSTRRRPGPAGRRVTRLAYVAVLALATLSPFQFALDPSAILAHAEEAFRTHYSPRDVVDALRNLALFAGWGALWVVTAPARGRRATLGIPLLTGLVLGTVVETLQLTIPDRTSSVLDVGTNTLGAGAGALLVVAITDIAERLRTNKSYVGVPALTFFGAYLSAAVLEATVPLDLPPIVGVYGGPLRRARESLGEFALGSITAISLTDMLLVFPLGVFAVATLRELGVPYRQAVGRSIRWATVLFVATELAHAPLGLPVVIGATLCNIAGVTVGALAAGRWLPAFSQDVRGAARPAALLVAYVTVLALWAWRPYVPTTSAAELAGQLTPDRLIPLHALGHRVDVHSVADVGKSFFLHLPLGALLAVWPLRRRGLFAGPLPGMYLAGFVECGQLLIRDRFFDVTDALVQAAAVGIGWEVIRRARYSVYGQIWWSPKR